MTDLEKQHVLAEWLGIKVRPAEEKFVPNGNDHLSGYIVSIPSNLPRLTLDLLYECVKKAPSAQVRRYRKILREVVGRALGRKAASADCVDAPREQREEAFIKAIGKWHGQDQVS